MPTIHRISSRRTRLRGLALAGVVALSLVAVAPAAQAEGSGARVTRSSSQCEPGHFCLWSDSLHTGGFWATPAMGTRETAVTFPRSVWNRMGVAVRTYSASNGTGSWICWSSGAKSAQTGVPAVSIVTMSAKNC